MLICIQRNSLILLALILILLSFASGWVSFIRFGNVSKYCNVLFFSKEEVLMLEEKRASKANESLFLGKANAAIDLLLMAKEKLGSKNKKVITDFGHESTKGAINHSQEVHEMIIDILKNKTVK